MSFFSVNHITAGYAKDPVIHNICFELEAGCVLGFLGANGSGKTTLLKSICGIIPHTGESMLDGCRLETLSARQLARKVSYIPQRSGISIDISALDVVLMGFNPQLGLLEHPTNHMRSAANNALARVGLSGKESMNYLHLSEGQKQLCILARTLVAESKLLLLDEPESALDFQNRYQMLAILRKWVEKQDRAAIVTLHDPNLALNYCDRLILLSEGQITGSLLPHTDTPHHMERLLSNVYGPVSVQSCSTCSGQQLVMLKEGCH